MPRFIIAAAVLLTLFLSTPAFSQSTNAIREHPGSCIGYASCYVAALVQRLATERQKADLGGALAKSVHAARVLHLAGYADGDADTLADLRFPVRKVVDALSAPEIRFLQLG